MFSIHSEYFGFYFGLLHLSYLAHAKTSCAVLLCFLLACSPEFLHAGSTQPCFPALPANQVFSSTVPSYHRWYNKCLNNMKYGIWKVSFSGNMCKVVHCEVDCAIFAYTHTIPEKFECERDTNLNVSTFSWWSTILVKISTLSNCLCLLNWSYFSVWLRLSAVILSMYVWVYCFRFLKYFVNISFKDAIDMNILLL